MRPTLEELEHLCAAFNTAVGPGPIEKLWRPTPTSLLLELRSLRNLPIAEGTKRPRLFIDLAPPEPWLAITSRWPDTPAQPDRTTLELRKHLEGASIALAAVEADRRLVFVCTPRGQRPQESAPSLELIVQLAGRYPQLGVILDGQPLVQLLPVRAIRDEDSPPLKRGATPPQEPDGHFLLTHGETAWERADQRDSKRELQQLQTQLQRTIRKHRQRIQELESQALKAEERHRLFYEAELLKTALNKITPKATEVVVTDYAQDPPAQLTLALDPSLSPKEQLARRFTRYRKLTRTAEATTEQLAQEQEALFELELLEDTLTRSPEALASLQPQLRALLGPPKSPQQVGRTREEGRLPYRSFFSADGTELRAGRSARDNDTLTFRLSRGSDYFFHARDVSGSHVILCHRCREAPHPETLLDAAVLAAHLSQARHEGVVDVLYVERKYVKRVRGAAPGRVQTAAAKTMSVRLDEARLNRLYASQEEPNPEA